MYCGILPRFFPATHLHVYISQLEISVLPSWNLRWSWHPHVVSVVAKLRCEAPGSPTQPATRTSHRARAHWMEAARNDPGSRSMWETASWPKGLRNAEKQSSEATTNHAESTGWSSFSYIFIEILCTSTLLISCYVIMWISWEVLLWKKDEWKTDFRFTMVHP